MRDTETRRGQKELDCLSNIPLFDNWPLSWCSWPLTTLPLSLRNKTGQCGHCPLDNESNWKISHHLICPLTQAVENLNIFPHEYFQESMNCNVATLKYQCNKENEQNFNLVAFRWKLYFLMGFPFGGNPFWQIQAMRAISHYSLYSVFSVQLQNTEQCVKGCILFGVERRAAQYLKPAHFMGLDPTQGSHTQKRLPKDLIPIASKKWKSEYIFTRPLSTS